MLNRLKTFLYLTMLTGVLIGVGVFLGGTTGALLAFGLAFLINFISYWYSDKIILKMYGGEKLEDEKINNMVKEISEKLDIPKPRVYEIDFPKPNAFATGRNPNHAAIALTKSLMKKLDDDELKSVIGHELSHVKHYDTLVSSVSAILAGAIMIIGRFLFISFLFRGRGRGGGASFLIFAILTPIVALLLRTAISRSREYLADRGGAEVTSPQSMISALKEIHSSSKLKMNRGSAPTTSSLFIRNPFKMKSITKLFSTHPSLEKRISSIEEHFDSE